MSNEEKIIKIINHLEPYDLPYSTDEVYVAIKKLLDLYLKEKEKNKELEDCLQMAKQIITYDISEDFDFMELKEFKEYLLNEIKQNENFEE